MAKFEAEKSLSGGSCAGSGGRVLDARGATRYIGSMIQSFRHAGLERFYLTGSKAGIQPAFTAVIGTVQGDLHDIGKNLVAMMWRGANFGVVDLGTNVTPEKFAAAAKEHNARVVGLSALLTTTMPAMKTTVDAIRAAGLTHTAIVIGGAPITAEFAREIGADAYAPDAASAVDVVRKLVAA